MAKTHKCISRKHKTCGKGGRRMFSANGAEWHAANNGGRFKTAKPKPEVKSEPAPAPMPAAHTRGGQPLTGTEPYGTTHDMDCPGCKDVPFAASPRSEAYFAS